VVVSSRLSAIWWKGVQSFISLCKFSLCKFVSLLAQIQYLDTGLRFPALPLLNGLTNNSLAFQISLFDLC
jgi:hypothetical protein